jgi:hypothetical protein
VQNSEPPEAVGRGRGSYRELLSTRARFHPAEFSLASYGPGWRSVGSAIIHWSAERRDCGAGREGTTTWPAPWIFPLINNSPDGERGARERMGARRSRLCTTLGELV